MGDAYLEFVRDAGQAIGEATQERRRISAANRPPIRCRLVQNVQGQFTSTIGSVRDTSDSFRGTSDNLQLTLQKLNAMLDENRRGIKTAIDQANDILADTRDDHRRRRPPRKISAPRSKNCRR